MRRVVATVIAVVATTTSVTIATVASSESTETKQSSWYGSAYGSDAPYKDHYPYVTWNVDIGTWARIARAEAQRKEAHQRIERRKRKAEAEQATESGATSVPHIRLRHHRVRHPRVWSHVRRETHLGNGRCDSCRVARRVWHFLH
jgi:hypothetical protein